jgi:hypothetical protein
MEGQRAELDEMSFCHGDWKMKPNVAVRAVLAAAALGSIGLSPTPAAAMTDGVDELRELMIVHPSVVDPFLNGGLSHNGTANSPGGIWSLRGLLSVLTAGIPASQRDAFYASFFERWLTAQTTDNGTTLAPRDPAKVQHLLLDQFSHVDPATGQRVFEMWKVPFELTAIVYRPDLRAADGSDGGELRFVFKLVGPDGEDPPMTLIMEYKIRTYWFDALTWAHNFHRLGTLEIGSAEYLRALGTFTWYQTHLLLPDKPAVKHIRTNEIAFAPPNGKWELRQFDQNRTSPTANVIVPSAVENTPLLTLNNSSALADFIAANPVLAQPGTAFMDLVMPQQLDMGAGPVAFLDASSEAGIKWMDGSPSSVASDNFGLLTCNGCHQDNKSNLPGEIEFYHVKPDVSPGQDGLVRLSKFLTTADPDKPDRRPGELVRRAGILNQILTQPWSPTWIDY